MTIQDFFSTTYYSQRLISDRLVAHGVADVIIQCALPGKELEAKQLIEREKEKLAKSESDFILIRSEIFESFGIDAKRFVDIPNPADEAIKQLELYATQKGFFYEQAHMLAIYLGLFVQAQSQIRDSLVKADDKGLAESISLLNDRILSLIPILTGANSEALVTEFKFIISNPSKYSINQLDFFMDKICSSLFFPANLEASKNSNSNHQISISGNVSGSTIIIGNENDVQN
jgi:hypothetical protein